VHWFEVRTNFELRVSHDEWQWTGWLSPAAVIRIREEGKIPPDDTLFIDTYSREWEHVARVE